MIIFKFVIGLGILKIIVSLFLGASKNCFVCALSFILKVVFPAVKNNKHIFAGYDSFRKNIKLII